MRSRHLLGAAGAGLLALVAGPLATVQAAPESAAVSAEGNSSLVMVLDSSGSMT